MPTMLAAVLHDYDDLRLDQVPVPRAAEVGDVVVEVKSCGFCLTDYKAIKGIRRNVTFPFLPGHEPSGTVAEVGPGVEHFRVGDQVVVQPLGHCGFCRNCRTGSTHYCEHAFVTGGDGPDEVWPGAFAQYLRTKETCLYPKPPQLSFDAAAITEPLAAAWKGVIHHSQMQLSDDVVIIGAGSMGLLCLMVAKAAGAAHLIAVDTSEYALRRASDLGATHTVNPTEADPKSRISQIIPRGPDLVIEAAGAIEAVRLMVDLRRRGTRWNVFGITTPEQFSLDGGLTHFLEGRMDASFGTTSLAMSQALRLMETRLIDTEKIISHRFPLSRINDALAVMESHQRTKVVINP